MTRLDVASFVWPKEVQSQMMKSTMNRRSCGCSVCAGAAIDEPSPEAPWPLIQSERLHIHCFLALMYYREQAAVCAVTAWIKLCHSRFTAAAILFRCRPETVRGEDITLICQPSCVIPLSERGPGEGGVKVDSFDVHAENKKSNTKGGGRGQQNRKW